MQGVRFTWVGVRLLAQGHWAASSQREIQPSSKMEADGFVPELDCMLAGPADMVCAFGLRHLAKALQVPVCLAVGQVCVAVPS